MYQIQRFRSAPKLKGFLLCHTLHAATKFSKKSGQSFFCNPVDKQTNELN